MLGALTLIVMPASAALTRATSIEESERMPLVLIMSPDSKARKSAGDAGSCGRISTIASATFLAASDCAAVSFVVVDDPDELVLDPVPDALPLIFGELILGTVGVDALGTEGLGAAPTLGAVMVLTFGKNGMAL